MNIRVATFNVENLFSRAKTLSLQDWAAKAPVLADIQRLNELLARATYSTSNKTEIKDILERNRVAKDGARKDFTINQVRDKLYRVVNSQTGTVSVTASGRDDWIGWVEMKREVFDKEAVRNTARVIEAVDADILCLVEVEDRFTLREFNEQILVAGGFLTGDREYKYSMLIEGNDDRGIDVAILSRRKILRMRSHTDDLAPGPGSGRIFSRDCAEYEVELPGNRSLWLLVNHFKSKLGNAASSNAARLRQAERVKAILESGYDLAQDYVIVAGDLNDTPGSPPLAPLLDMPRLHNLADELEEEERWTYYYDGFEQIDYLLASDALHARLAGERVGVERRGMYTHNDFDGQYPHTPFPEVTGYKMVASDHAALWADFDL